MMTNSDAEGRMFLSNPHTNNGFFFLLVIVLLFRNKITEVPGYAKMQFHLTTMCVSFDTTNVFSPHVAAWVR